MPYMAGSIESGFLLIVLGIKIRVMLQQHRHSIRVSEMSRSVESAPPMTVLRIHLGAVRQQQRHRIRTSMRSRDVERTQAGMVHRFPNVRAALQEHRQYIQVPELRGAPWP